MAWETEQELETAWLGGYGPDEEREAEELLDAALGGEHGEELQAAAVSMMERLSTYVDEGHPTGEQLAAELQEQEVDDAGADIDPDELSAAEQREIAAEQADHFTALLVAELERFADHVKGRPLTPGEIDEVVALVPTEALDGGAFPDLVGQHGSELKERWSTREHRHEAAAEAVREVRETPDAPDRVSFAEHEVGDDDRRDRLNRGAQAVAALQAAHDEPVDEPVVVGAADGGEDE